MTVTIEQFLRQIHELQLVPLSVLKSVLAPFQRDSHDARQVADKLTREGVLTRFQAERLLEGNGKRLVLGTYVIEEFLGRGGIGRVYRARHRLMDRAVAVKILSREILASRSARRRFQREMRVAAKLTHPNLVIAFDAGEQAGEPYLVMEYIPGPNLLEQVKEQGPLDVTRAIELLIQVSRGLEYAHGRGIIHRDIKPANLMVDPEGTVKLLDMGLAQHLSIPEDSSPAGSGDSLAIAGTPDFMSPEQSLEVGRIDERSDIYSLGCTLFYLLTGRPMFEQEDMQRKIDAHRNRAAPRLGDFCDDLPAELESVFRRMVAKNKQDRFPSATALREALESLRRSESVTLIHFASAETEPSEDRSENSAPVPRRSPALKSPFLLVAIAALLMTLFAWNRPRKDPRIASHASADLSVTSRPDTTETNANPPQLPPRDLGFALEFDGESQVVLPGFDFEHNHVLIADLELTPLPTERSDTEDVFTHADSQSGWMLRVQDARWNLSLRKGESPLVQLNSIETIRRGELVRLSLVIHPQFAALSLDGTLQAEWEGNAEFLPVASAFKVGSADLSRGFVGKIQSIRLSKADRLLVDETGRRLLPEVRETVAEYRFDEGDGPLLGDSSGAERHGTIEGAVWSFSD